MMDPLDLRILGVFVIMLVSALGVIFPIFLVRADNPRLLSFLEVLRCVAVGLVLGVTLMHLLPEAVEHIEGVAEYPWAFFFCGVGVIVMLFFEQVTEHLSEGTGHEHGPGGEHDHAADAAAKTQAAVVMHVRTAPTQQCVCPRSHNDPALPLQQVTPPAAPADHDTARLVPGSDSSQSRHPQGGQQKLAVPPSPQRGVGSPERLPGSPERRGSTDGGRRPSFLHPHDPMPEGVLHSHHEATLAMMKDKRFKLKAYMIESSIAVHSVLVGLGLGVLTEIPEIQALLIALCFHQFFEGVALGGAVAKANQTKCFLASLILLFSFSCPAGVAIGIGVT
jgi:zinc transporter 1/2/3